MSKPPEQANSGLILDRRHPVARRIIQRWRQLIESRGGRSSGEPTMIACSGGADSTALVLALAAAGAELTLLFAEHDARARSLVQADRDIVEQLARAIDADFVSVPCPTGSATPSENLMRHARYRAIAAEARRRSVRFVATGHHADDQLETMLLALIRGGGPLGMAGMRESRPIDDELPPVHLIRPMLGISREEAESLCLSAGAHRPGTGTPSWAEDHTNEDTAYLRNRVRHEILPLLHALRPGLPGRAARNAEWFRQLGELLTDQAKLIDRDARLRAEPEARVWSRSALAEALPVVAGEVIRRAVGEEQQGEGLDRLDGEKLATITAAIGDRVTDPRVFEIGSGIMIRVTAHEVELFMKKAP